MLSKGSELFEFERDLFNLKKKYISEDMDDKWQDLMNDGDTLLRKYKDMGDMIAYYTFESFCCFVDFLDKKSKGDYKPKYVR